MIARQRTTLFHAHARFARRSISVATCRLQTTHGKYHQKHKSGRKTASILTQRTTNLNGHRIMTNFSDVLKQIHAAGRWGTPASLVCVFTVTILGVTATLCMRHPDPAVQKCAMALFCLVSGGSSFSMLAFLWHKPEVFRSNGPGASTARSTSRRQPPKGTIPVATPAEAKSNQPAKAHE